MRTNFEKRWKANTGRELCHCVSTYLVSSHTHTERYTDDHTNTHNYSQTHTYTHREKRIAFTSTIYLVLDFALADVVMSPCKKCFQQMVVNFCLNTWHRNVEIVTFLKWCLSVFTNTTCVLLGGLHCLIVDTYTAGSEEHFCKEKVWLTPSSNKVFMVSSMPSLGRTTCLTHRSRPLRPYFYSALCFRVLPVEASQYNLHYLST